MVIARPFKTYMLDFSHYFHLHVYFVIKDTILHKASFLEFLCSVGDAIEFGRDLIYDSKSTFTNAADLVVFRTSFPFLDISSDRCRRILNISIRKEI